MTTSQKTFSLYEPSGDKRIERSTLAYFQSRNKHRVYEFVLNEFIKSGISQASLARRLGKGADQVNRWLSAPGNWTLDTVSDLLFAIKAGEADYTISYPLKKDKKNYSSPEWLEDSVSIPRSDQPKALTKSSLLEITFGS